MKTKLKKKLSIDRQSPYYRVCCNCNHEFLAKNMKEIHCTPKCADAFSNHRKKLEDKLREFFGIPKVPYGMSKQVRINLEKSNIPKFEVLNIDPVIGSVFSDEELKNYGINLRGYGKRVLIGYNEEAPKYAILIGKYMLVHVKDGQIRIFK